MFTGRSAQYRQRFYVPPPTILVDWAEKVVKKHHPHIKPLPTQERG